MNRDCSLILLGDSYTTFAGHIPDGNWSFYPRDAVPDVVDVSQTWWWQLIAMRHLKLLVNESSSGTTISCRVREVHTPADAFISRMKRALGPDGAAGEKPQLILIMGGTNDSWIGNEAGQLQFDSWTDEDLLQVLPAACYMMDYIIRHNPQAEVRFMLNTDLREEIADGLKAACAHYGVPVLELKDVSKQSGHPDAEGMRQIARQVDAWLDGMA